MGLPATRNTTYLSNSLPKVKAADLNAIQDAIIALVTGTSTTFATGLSFAKLLVDATGGAAVSLAAGVIAKVTGGALQLEGASGDTNSDGVSTTVPTARKLWWTWTLNANIKARLYYATSAGAYEVVLNAVWGGATWSCDDSTKDAVRFRLQSAAASGDMAIHYHAGTAGTWADGAWTANVFSAGATGMLTSAGGVTATAGGVTATAGGVTVTAGGVTVNGGTVASTAGTAGAPSVTLTDANTGMYRPGANQLGLATNGTVAVSIDSSQNATFGGASTTVVQLKTSTASVAVAGGASTPAFVANSAGGAGQPTTAAQNSWLKALDSTGATIWIPVWK